jgi:mycothiol synthase
LAEYSFRAARSDDVPAVAELARAVALADYGEDEDDAENIAIVFGLIDLERDAWVVEGPPGRIVARGMVRVRHPTRLRSIGEVLPEHRGRGLGGELLRRIEARAGELAEQAPPGEEVWLGQEVAPANDRARELVVRNGFERLRHFWKMVIDLDEEFPEPEWPDGIRLVPFDLSQAREVFDASEDAFQDHWGHTPHEFEEWRAWMIERDSFDPSLWLIAREGDEVTGVSFCYAAPQEGWVGVLGVRRPWRRRGLGRALLLESFRQLQARGLPRAALGVDAENPTGATRLYERAGMRIVFESHAYRKILRR